MHMQTRTMERYCDGRIRMASSHLGYFDGIVRWTRDHNERLDAQCRASCHATLLPGDLCGVFKE